MTEEYNALLDNRTWSLVPRPVGANIVSGKWIFKHKFTADGGLARYKARWVVRGLCQWPEVDFDKTFSFVVKPATILNVLSIAVSCAWPIHGTLDEEVYCEQPPATSTTLVLSMSASFTSPRSHRCRLCRWWPSAQGRRARQASA
jgi:hypothetical protein